MTPRSYILFYLNGKAHRVEGEAVFDSLANYLRYEQGLTGTKVVCAEGDCGSCTVLLGTLSEGEEHPALSYKPVNSCIQYLYQLDCTHVITVEGIRCEKDAQPENLHPVQEAMLQCHGAQCGYCTPGFVMSLVDLCEKTPASVALNQTMVAEAVTGNLCRCTGYEPIVKAGCSVDRDAIMPLPKLYPEAPILEDLQWHQKLPVLSVFEKRMFYSPVTLQEACAFLDKHAAGVTVVSGGTDISVYANKRGLEPALLMGLNQIPGLQGVDLVFDSATSTRFLSVGARVTLALLEQFVQDVIPTFAGILDVFGAPQIKQAGTLAGNIANGSPIADTPPFLMVMEALVEVTGTRGVRQIKMTELYTGYKQMSLQPDELITRILIPLPKPTQVLKLYKFSKRKNLDISTLTAAFLFERDAQNVIQLARVAYGGVAATVLRFPKTEAFLLGKPWSLETFVAAGEVVASEMTPISDVRGSARFRALLARNVLQKLFYHVLEEETPLKKEEIV